MSKISSLSAALVVLSLAAPPAPPLAALSPPLEIWVETGEPIPGRPELATPFFAVMGPEDLAFAGLDLEATAVGVFVADRNGILDLVGDRFWNGAMAVSYDGAWLSFTAFSDGCDEECFTLYRYADGGLTEVIQAGDPVPGRPGEIVFGFGSTSTDAGELVFEARIGPPGGPAAQAVLRFTEAAGVEVVLDEGTVVPGAGAASFTVFDAPRISGGALYFQGTFPGGEGVFVERGGEVSRVAVTGEPVPGGLPGEVFEDFPDEAFLSASDGAVAFVAESSLGSRHIVWNVDGTLALAVDGGTPVPGGAGQLFGDFGQVSLSGRDLVFEAPVVPFPGVDLFLLRDGAVTRIADGVCSDRLIVDASFRDGRVAFFRPQEERGRLRVVHLDTPPPQGETYASARYPDFRFTVRITAGTETIPTRLEPECVADALCIGGALPGRAELSLRILGPRPNGFLWPVIGRLSPSRIEVWVEQLSTGLTRYYLLDALPRDSGELTGLVDRRGFPATP